MIPSDLSFDWHITWTAATPLRLAALSPFSAHTGASGPDGEPTDDELATGQDFVDILRTW